LFEVFRIGVVKRSQLGAVDVEDGDDYVVVEDGDDDFAAGGRGAGDVSGKLLHVGYHEGAAFLPRAAADAASERDARAGQRPLERSQHQFVADDAIEASPPEPKGFVQHGRHVRHVGDEIDAWVHHRLDLREEGFVLFLFGHYLVCSYCPAPTLRSFVAFVGLIAVVVFSPLFDPTLRSFVACVGLIALRASCPFGTV